MLAFLRMTSGRCADELQIATTVSLANCEGVRVSADENHTEPASTSTSRGEEVNTGGFDYLRELSCAQVKIGEIFSDANKFGVRMTFCGWRDGLVGLG